jgi:hypothetical protein
MRYIHRYALTLLGMSLLFGIFVLLSHRLIFSGLLTGLLCILAHFIHQAKFNTLNEPLTFADLRLYLQVFQFPHFYLPFINAKVLIGGALLSLSILFGLIYIETPLMYFNVSPYISSVYFASLLLLLATVGYFYTSVVPFTQQIQQDFATYGLLANIVLYAFQNVKAAKRLPQEGMLQLPTKVQHSPIICIQSESYFDLRKMLPGSKHALLDGYYQAFDRLKQQSMQQGHLSVPSWGAYTMRSEFALLTGIKNQALRLGQYDPLRFYQNKNLPSLVWQLKQQGYYCVCIHPYYRHFFARHKVYPNLGFDEFIDISQFQDAELNGRYISDACLNEKIIEVLDRKKDKPLFIFAITIENHGPYESESPLVDGSPFCCLDEKEQKSIQGYLEHVKSADQMIDGLMDKLSADYPASLLLWYGDHMPALNSIYRHYGYQGQTTDYAIWSPEQLANDSRQSQPHPISIEQLLSSALKYERKA